MIQDLPMLLVEAATSLFDVILMVTFLNGFLIEKEISLTRKILAVLTASALVFTGSILFSRHSVAMMLNYFLITLIFSIVMYNNKLVHKLFSCVLLLAILLMVEFITAMMHIWITDLDAATIRSDPFMMFVGVIIKNVISLAAIRIICSYRKSSIRDAGRLYTFFLMIVPVISIMVSIIIFEIARKYKIEDISIILVAFLGLMYINAIVFALFESIMRHLDKEYKYQMIENQLEMQISHYKKLAENREILSEVVHDFKNHLNCIYNLYKYDKGDELGKYIENLISVSDTEKVIDTGNPVIDALLHDKSNAAQKEGINFRHVLNLPSDLNIAYSDICAVLGNSLDNAIEACRRIEDKNISRDIELSMNYRDSYLVIVVSNTIDKPPQKEGKFFKSSKESSGLHGLGMQSIERTVRKYSGNMVVKYDSSRFTLEIVMSLA